MAGTTAGMVRTATVMVAMTRTRRPRPRRSLRPTSLIALAVLQVLCALFFVESLVVSVFGLRSEPLSWTWRELLEIFATVGLVLGMVLAGSVIRTLIRQRREDAERLRIASGDFYAVIQSHFETWSLTPSERDVAIFILKGFSNSEIAGLRETSEGTIKAQTTAIFRKSGVSGRAQFFSLFIEELLAEDDAHDSSGRGKPEGP